MSDNREEILSVVKEVSCGNLKWDVIKMCFIIMCLFKMKGLEEFKLMRYCFLFFFFKIKVKLFNSGKDC